MLTVAHDKFNQLTTNDIKFFDRGNHRIYDVKNMFDTCKVNGRP